MCGGGGGGGVKSTCLHLRTFSVGFVPRLFTVECRKISLPLSKQDLVYLYYLYLGEKRVLIPF